jgi:drug/metabolite transporter (DMT)-like permease
METDTHRPRWKTLLAFAIIYFVWGSTFLAIRIGVREVPPLLLAAMRFLVAGLVLYGWMIARPPPQTLGGTARRDGGRSCGPKGSSDQQGSKWQ